MGLFYVTPTEASRFLAALKRKIDAMERHYVEVYRGVAIAVFNLAMQETPQWSGNAAANWNFDTNAPSYKVDSRLRDENIGSGPKNLSSAKFTAPVAVKGDPRATAISFARAQRGFDNLTGLAMSPGVASRLTLRTFINNASEDGSGTKYIQMVEENPNNYLRKENEPGHALENAIKQVYGRIAPRVYTEGTLIWKNQRPGTTL